MPTDLLIGDDFDLIIENGDFVVGDSTAQHQNLLLLSQKGEWKNNPSAGVGIEDWLDDDEVQGLAEEIESQFAADEMLKPITVKIFKDGNMDINAKYGY